MFPSFNPSPFGNGMAFGGMLTSTPCRPRPHPNVHLPPHHPGAAPPVQPAGPLVLGNLPWNNPNIYDSKQMQVNAATVPPQSPADHSENKLQDLQESQEERFNYSTAYYAEQKRIHMERERTSQEIQIANERKERAELLVRFNNEKMKESAKSKEQMHVVPNGVGQGSASGGGAGAAAQANAKTQDSRKRRHDGSSDQFMADFRQGFADMSRGGTMMPGPNPQWMAYQQQQQQQHQMQQHHYPSYPPMMMPQNQQQHPLIGMSQPLHGPSMMNGTGMSVTSNGLASHHMGMAPPPQSSAPACSQQLSQSQTQSMAGSQQQHQKMPMFEGGSQLSSCSQTVSGMCSQGSLASSIDMNGALHQQQQQLQQQLHSQQENSPALGGFSAAPCPATPSSSSAEVSSAFPPSDPAHFPTQSPVIAHGGAHASSSYVADVRTSPTQVSAASASESEIATPPLLNDTIDNVNNDGLQNVVDAMGLRQQDGNTLQDLGSDNLFPDSVVESESSISVAVDPFASSSQQQQPIGGAVPASAAPASVVGPSGGTPCSVVSPIGPYASSSMNGPHSVHSVHSQHAAPMSNGNCNYPMTPTNSCSVGGSVFPNPSTSNPLGAPLCSSTPLQAPSGPSALSQQQHAQMQQQQNGMMSMGQRGAGGAGTGVASTSSAPPAMQPPPYQMAAQAQQRTTFSGYSAYPVDMAASQQMQMQMQMSAASTAQQQMRHQQQQMQQAMALQQRAGGMSQQHQHYMMMQQQQQRVLAQQQAAMANMTPQQYQQMMDTELQRRQFFIQAQARAHAHAQRYPAGSMMDPSMMSMGGRMPMLPTPMAPSPSPSYPYPAQAGQMFSSYPMN